VTQSATRGGGRRRSARAVTLRHVPTTPAATTDTRTVLDVAGLRKSFGALHVLDHVDLRVARNETVALVGDNGVGKSTVVRCIAHDIAADGGTITVSGAPHGRTPAEVRAQGIAVVHQHPALCGNLDVTANLFLGRERGRWLLAGADMRLRAERLLSDLHIAIDDVEAPLGGLSGGQQRSVALARAMVDLPQLVVLDEPTAALPAEQARQVEVLIRNLRDGGASLLLVTHSLTQAFTFADRIVVLRGGRIVAEVTPAESHPDDVRALMAGTAIDSTARRQLRRLHSLTDQLAEVAPSASLPLIMAGLADALDEDMLAVHLYEGDQEPPRLRRSAAVGVPLGVLDASLVLPIGPGGGVLGRCAAVGDAVQVEDLRQSGPDEPLRDAALADGIVGVWAVPVISNERLLGVVSGYRRAAGRLQRDQLELASLYAGYAAAAIDRDRVLWQLRERNDVLEALRTMLEALAGAERFTAGFDAALETLRRGLHASGIELQLLDGDELASRTSVGQLPDDVDRTRLRAVAHDRRGGAVTRLDATTAAAAMAGRGVLVVGWPRRVEPSPEVLRLLDASARSLCLAIEGDELAKAREQAEALRESHALQRQVLERLSHELRTPLTAVHGYASTLLQPDVDWDEPSRARFLSAIARESDRLRGLVTNLLDASAIESGVLRLHLDWCDLRYVLEAAVAVMPRGTGREIAVDLPDDLPPVWADHDRLEQVFVNLLHNAVVHTPAGTMIRVDAGTDPSGATVHVRVADDGPGIPADDAEAIFAPHVTGGGSGGAGLGLAIARGIVAAHGGTLTLADTRTGATFICALPTDSGAGPEHPAPLSPLDAEEPT
jgi:signal transduction histidine kinase/ABC-type multidrug transport system ATPase subunit